MRDLSIGNALPRPAATRKFASLLGIVRVIRGKGGVLVQRAILNLRSRAVWIAGLFIACSAGYSNVARPPEGLVAALRILQEQDARAGDIFFRLVVSNVPLCSQLEAQSGLQIHDLGQYRAALRPAAIEAFGLGKGPSVLAVAVGSPAAAAGLRPNDKLTEIGGIPLRLTDLSESGGSFTSTAANLSALRAALNRGPTSIRYDRDGIEHIAKLNPITGCASDMQVVPDRRLDSGTNGQLVSITTGLIDFSKNDSELAVVVGHELAHNILDHRRFLSNRGVPRGILSHFGKASRLVRGTEIDADRFGLYLAARAGYLTTAGPDFWRRYGANHGYGVLGDSTHPTERARVAALDEVVLEIEQLRAAGKPLLPGIEFKTNY